MAFCTWSGFATRTVSQEGKPCSGAMGVLQLGWVDEVGGVGVAVGVAVGVGTGWGGVGWGGVGVGWGGVGWGWAGLGWPDIIKRSF